MDKIAQQNLAKKIASYSKIYKRALLGRWDKEKLLTDWNSALLFFFGHSFYQGRRDALSERFEKRAEEVIQKNIKSIESALTSSDRDYFSEKSKLDTSLQEEGVNKRLDRLMVLSTLNFIKGIDKNNIVLYSLNTEDLPNIFQQLLTIKSVGDKIASFYLRDLDFVFDIAKSLVNKEDYILMQPLDTWVRKISIQLGIVQNQKDTYWMKKAVVKFCLEANINPNDYNVGAWYVGSHKINVNLNGAFLRLE